jgi:hypothetical protein
VSASTYPSSTTIYSGSLLGGDAAALRADDGSVFQVGSTTSGSRLTSWYGRVKGVSNASTRMSVIYRGSHSRSCTQSLYLWNWSNGYWVRAQQSAAGPTKTDASFTAIGSLASYVSGSGGDGDVAVRVHCTRSDTVAFTTSADFMRVTFWKPS